MPEHEKKLKIAIVHDHLGWQGGGERTSLLLALSQGADYITAYASTDTYPDYQKELGSHFKTLTNKPVHIRGVRFFWLRWLFWKNRKLLKQYDVLIASGQPAMEAVAAYAKQGATKIVYNHTPPRRVFDLYQQSRLFYPPILRPLFSVFIRFWRSMYFCALDKMDFDIANSETVRTRMVKYTGREVNAIIRPPILTDKFKWLADGDYFLSWARLDEAKRVELIVAAFAKMPDKKLVVASTGPRLEACKKIAANSPNITFVGALPDDELFTLVGRCSASIYIPVNEDAGMTHLEGNAAGKPVLGVNEGGLIDTIIDGETGIKLPANPSVDDLIAGIKKMTPAWCASRKDACVDYATNFSYQVFAQRINEVIRNNDPRRPVVGIDASRWEDPRRPGEGKRSGVEIYSWHLIGALVKFFADKSVRLRLYTPRAIPDLPLTVQKIIPPQKLWTIRGLGRELKRLPPDIFFTPAYFIPAHAPKKSYAVIHDLAFLTAPHRYGLVDWLSQHLAWSANMHRAAKLIAVSQATKNEIARLHPRLTAKTVVVPPGYAPMPALRGAGIFNPGDDVRKTGGVTNPASASGYANAEPGFLIPAMTSGKRAGLQTPPPQRGRLAYVGRLDKKKSVVLLINVFSKIAKRFPEWSLDLVGGDGLGADEIHLAAAASEAQNKIVFHGYATETEKFAVLGAATIFVQPGSAEGSALSLLEAWDAGAASLVADIPVMREIGQDGALYFKPENTADLEAKLIKLIEDKNLREQLIAEGKKNLANFSWDTTAQEIGKLILE